MPICISPELPAYQVLQKERIFVMTEDRAAHQDIRPLRVLVLNPVSYTHLTLPTTPEV